MVVKSGIVEGIPYSLSRWTDLPAAKWAWMMECFREQKMIAFDPRTAVPSEWSLKPEDTLGLVFWTKDPRNLLVERQMLKSYRLQIHMTITGWEEVEKGAPLLNDALWMLEDTVAVFGPENVLWRFSPVPAVPDAVARFRRIVEVASGAGLREVYLSFLQQNDLMPEQRDPATRLGLLVEMAEVAERYGVAVRLCNEDRLLARVSGLPKNLGSGVCSKPESFELPGHGRPPSEGCGCVLMADPFTINETCTMGCQYCYAADKTLAPKKHNTTRSLPIIR